MYKPTTRDVHERAIVCYRYIPDELYNDRLMADRSPRPLLTDGPPSLNQNRISHSFRLCSLPFLPRRLFVDDVLEEHGNGGEPAAQRPRLMPLETSS